MENKQIDRLIELLTKWKADDLNWGECCELREFSYQFGDAIQKYWDEW